MKPLTIHEKAARHFASQSSMALSIILLAVAAFLVWVALHPDNTLFKAAVAAWVLLP